MKNILLLLAIAFCSSVFSQTITVTFKPDAETGKNARIYTNYGCTHNGNIIPTDDMNFRHVSDLGAAVWTFSALGCSEGVFRGLLKFDELSTIPQSVRIISAELKLYGNPSYSTGISVGNSVFPGSPYNSYGSNQSSILRVTGDWDDRTVTWNTQPTTTTNNKITIPQTTSQWSWNFSDSSENLVAMIQDMVTNPETNFGFMIKLDTESLYRSVQFASSNHSNRALHPELTVTYKYIAYGCTDPKALNYDPEATDSSREGCRCCTYANEENIFPPVEIPETPVDTLGTWAIEECWFTAANIVSARITEIEISDMDESGNNHGTNRPPHRHAYVTWEIVKEVGNDHNSRQTVIVERVQYCLDGKNSSMDNQPTLFYMSVVCNNPLYLRSGNEEPEMIAHTFAAFAYLRSGTTNISQPATESKNNVVVYPNPFTDKLTVLVKGAKTADIALYSIEGALLATYRNLDEVEIAASKLLAGVYIVKVTADGKTESVTVVKK